MEHNEVARTTQARVEFHSVQTKLERALKACERVLRRLARNPSMPENQPLTPNPVKQIQ